MLVLSRFCEQEIVIGKGNDAVYVKVLEIRGNKVRLGITGPKDTPIDRREIAIAKGTINADSRQVN